MFDQAGLVALTASATNPTLSENGWKTFFRGLANDAVQGPAVANYLKNTLNYKKICVIDDNTDYGLGLASAVRETLGPIADSGCNISVKKGDKDFSAAVTQVKGVGPDAVFYGGYYSEAAPLTQQLKDGGFTGTFVSADGTKDPEYVKQGGEATEGRHSVLPVRPRHRIVRRRVQEEVQRRRGHVQRRGLRPRHHPGQGHRLRSHHPARAAGLRQELQRPGCGP